MTNTKKLDCVEDTYRNTLKTEINEVKKEKLKLSWRGEFKFDAVIHENNKIVEIHCLSTAKFKTVSGKDGTSNLFKVFHDAQMMLLTGCKNNILAFIDDEFYNKVIKEQKNGKIFFHHLK